MKRRLMILVLASLIALPASTPAFAWDKIVSFGDSLSDDGNGLPNNGAPVESYQPASNGDVWLDYLAESMENVELDGRAIGGARTIGPVYNGVDIGMAAQIDRYIMTLPADADLGGVLFTVWIGGNDFLASPNPFLVIDSAIGNIDASVQALIDAGAEDILVMTLPDLGLAPGVRVQGPEASYAFTQASDIFNDNLKALVCTLNDKNLGNVKFYMADTFELLQYAVESGVDLGFTIADVPCQWAGAGPDCDGFIFYDGIHPTDATHKVLAALALGQVKHGKIDPDMNELLESLNPIQPRKPFVVNCFD